MEKELELNFENFEVNVFNLDMWIKIIRSYMNIAEVFYSKKQYKDVIQYGTKASEIYDRILSFLKENKILKQNDIEILEHRFSKEAKLENSKFQFLESISKLYEILGISYRFIAEEYFKKDEFDKSFEMAKNALLFNPDDLYVNFTFAKLLSKLDAKKEAIDSFEKVCSIDKNYAYGRKVLAELYDSDEINMLEKSIENYREYHKNEKGNEHTWTRQACGCLKLGLHEQCQSAAVKALEFNPSNNGAIVAYMLNMLEMEGYSQKEIKEASQKLVEAAVKKLNITKNSYSFDNVIADENRKIRLGYLSSDLNNHVVSNFILPIIQNHDKTKFDINLYMTRNKIDHVSEIYKEYANSYNDCSKMSLKEIADKIYNDKIDILIDLNIFSGDTKMYLLAYKPAPIQCVYMGYPNTSGLDTIDYILTDKNTISEGEEDLYTETPAYIDAGYEVYNFNQKFPDISPLPYDKNKFITLGIYNKPSKITKTIFEAWVKILTLSKKTKILFQYRKHYTKQKCEDVCKLFEKYGIHKDRIIFQNNDKSYFQNMQLADFALDTYPYTGTGTTMDSLLSGLPIVCLEGYNSSSRPSSRILKSINEEELIAKNVDEYIKKAIYLINHPDIIRKFRFSIRDKLKSSKLADYKGFTRSIEETYTKMWIKYCTDRKNNL